MSNLIFRPWLGTNIYIGQCRTGKPEPLKYCDGYWSRRIDEKNRLVYSVGEDSDIVILSCKGHCED